jgi:hypothetical protein
MRHHATDTANANATVVRYLDPDSCEPVEPESYRRLYDLLRPFSESSERRPSLRKKVSFERIKSEGYLWSDEVPPEKDLLDLEFERAPDSLGAATEVLFGLHTYGGYYGFFRPDLDEVIRLMVLSGWNEKKLDSVSRVYVTTTPHPSDAAWACYDRATDKHMAKTSLYVVS